MKEIVEINNPSKKKPRVLIAPLDWGLGHATRCIPLIKELLTAGCEVIIAAERDQNSLLQLEFPSLRHIELQGYRLKYGKKRWQTQLILLFQIPKILIRIKRENRWLKHYIARESPDAIISDNRYGLYSSKVFSVFITHQLWIQTPFGRAVGKRLQKINYRFIDEFNACWVPDFKNGITLAGKLSHSKRFPQTLVKYIGLLSRFEKENASPVSKDLLVLLSGPEPQRGIFEEILLPQLAQFNGKAVLVRGLPAEKDTITAPAHVEIYNHLPSAELNKLICESDFIVSRSGYSTIMDLAKLGRKSILVPTPGQTEQEYLAAHLSKNKIAISFEQHNFSISEALEAAREFPFRLFEYNDPSLLASAVAGLMKVMRGEL